MTPGEHTARQSLLQSAVLAMLIIILAGALGIYVLADRDLRVAMEFTSLAAMIDRQYSGYVDHEQLIHSAREAMLDRLDRYCAYHGPQVREQLDEEFSGAYGGIGITVVRNGQGLLIMSVREGGPAAEVGLLSGDIILTADSVSLAGLPSGESTGLLRGPEGTDVIVDVFRPVTADTITKTVTRRKIPLLHIPYAGVTDDSVMYVRVLDFESGATADLSDALDSLLADTSRPARGLVLDFRGNPGGLLAEAYRTANLFLEADQLIVGTSGRSRWNDDSYRSSGHDVTGGLPIAILVDRGSASAAEIVAGALQQLDRAVLVGDTTFGKGLVQNLFGLSDGGALRLTISRYYLEGNVFLNRFDSTVHDTGSGLAPDYPLAFIERHEFPRALENSLLLQQFANEHQEEIIEAAPTFALPDSWVDRFAEFARSHGFVFESSASELADLLVDLAIAEQRSPRLLRAAEDVLARAHRRDMAQYDQYAAYVKMRLRQLAYERKFGTFRTYAEVIVPEQPDIRYAANLVKELAARRDSAP